MGKPWIICPLSTQMSASQNSTRKKSFCKPISISYTIAHCIYFSCTKDSQLHYFSGFFILFSMQSEQREPSMTYHIREAFWASPIQCKHSFDLPSIMLYCGCCMKVHTIYVSCKNHVSIGDSLNCRLCLVCTYC